MTAQKAAQKIIYTLTDEAPALATYSLLPIIEVFSQSAGISIESKNISLSARILAAFADHLSPEQQIANDLQELSELVKEADSNIIKLPNISASLPQLKAAIKELQAQGYALPDYPEIANTEQQETIKSRYDMIKGSAVNPVLREGNSDRRVPDAAKQHAQNNPHTMGEWQSNSQSHVASMQQGDFYGSENSLTIEKESQFKIELSTETGETILLKDYSPLLPGEIIDTAVMSKTALRSFLSAQIKDAQKHNILLSIHLKATMMKVSDPIMFGHAVSLYFQDVFEKHQDTFTQLGVNANNGLADLLNKLKTLPDEQEKAIKADIQHCYDTQAALAMVNSEQGITNLHVPSDIIIDASMPALIRSSGKMWGQDGKLHDTKAIIPDRCYAGIYQQTIDFCRQQGAFDPATMGSVQNIGLMAQKAEEYGSHDKTFEISDAGIVRVIDDTGTCLLEQKVQKGDIWRMCQVKDLAIEDWIKLAISRAETTQFTTIFWLDEQRAHDRQLIKKVKNTLAQCGLQHGLQNDLQDDSSKIDIRIMSPEKAMQFSLAQVKAGKSCISVTGNVLRDYLTDLFPILELGTSAKMLSIVPLIKGGRLFETGAGGSAPRHVQQFLEENHLRWDSLGEFLALGASLEHLAVQFNNKKAAILAHALAQATAKLLEHNHSPARKTGELDTRGSHFYLALYWAKSLAEQSQDIELQAKFSMLANRLALKKDAILDELNTVQGNPVELKGYYYPDPIQLQQLMRPSRRFNSILS